jgi:lipopolysaccharide biosynthesis glycosyltransferase
VNINQCNDKTFTSSKNEHADTQLFLYQRNLKMRCEMKIIFDDDILKIIIEHQWVYIKIRYHCIFIIKTPVY